MFQTDREDSLYQLSIFILVYQALRSCSLYRQCIAGKCAVSADISIILMKY